MLNLTWPLVGESFTSVGVASATPKQSPRKMPTNLPLKPSKVTLTLPTSNCEFGQVLPVLSLHRRNHHRCGSIGFRKAAEPVAYKIAVRPDEVARALSEINSAHHC